MSDKSNEIKKTFGDKLFNVMLNFKSIITIDMANILEQIQEIKHTQHLQHTPLPPTHFM